MKKSYLILIIILFCSNIYAKPPYKEKDPDWPCIQVYIEELSWGSIWTGPVLDENTAKWMEDKELSLLVQKLMKRKTKETDGINQIKKYIKKNKSPEKLTKLFHGLFDTTNNTWKKRNKKLLNFGKRQRLTSEKISAKLAKIKELSKKINQKVYAISIKNKAGIVDLKRILISNVYKKSK